MYSYISGILRHKTLNAAIVDNRGIGYRIYTSSRSLAQLAIDTEVTFYTHLYVREDEITLYGFPEPEGVALFELLLGVSGIGPKAALNICSAGGTAEIYGAIVSKDYDWLTKIQGIGRKTAERLVLELKEKIAKNLNLDPQASPSSITSVDISVESQVLQALAGLGYPAPEVSDSIKQAMAVLGPNARVEEVLKAVLKTMAQAK